MPVSAGCKHNIETNLNGSLVLRDENGLLHSTDDVPAVSNGRTMYRAWWCHGRRHRYRGPAISRFNEITRQWELFYYCFGKLVGVSPSLRDKARDGVVVVPWADRETWCYQKEFEF